MRNVLEKHRVAVACFIAAVLAAAFIAVCIAFTHPGGDEGARVAAAEQAFDSPEPNAPGEGDEVAAVEDPSAEDGADDYVAPAQSEPAKTPSGMIVPEEMVPEVTAEHQEGVVFVSLAPGYSPEELTEAIDASGCTKPVEITEADVAAGFATLPVADGYDVAHAMTQLDMLPQTEGAQPNFVYHLADDIPGDGASGLARDIENRVEFTLTESPEPAGASLLAEAVSVTVDDPLASEQWALASIGAYEAWATVKADNRVTVAVLDNGCLTSHEDLKDNVVGAYNAVYKNSDVSPVDSHGTHTSGIVAARANNGMGVAGVSYNANVLPIKVFEGKNAYTSSLVNAYSYIMDNAGYYNIKVVNMSLGGTIEDIDSVDDIDLTNTDRAFHAAVDRAYNAGILTVCSAGNDAGSGKQNGPYFNYPSDWLDNALGVIALQQGAGTAAPSRASYSNYNMSGQRTKDISAPGSSVYSTSATGTSSYYRNSGTSMAAPCVAGVAALVYAANPDLSAQDVSEILCGTATKIGSGYDSTGFSLQYGYGEVDAAAAVEAAGTFIDGETSLFAGTAIELRMSTEGDWAWSSSNPSVATVDGGVVTGVAPGHAVITATNGSDSASKSITVYRISISGKHTAAAGAVTPLSFNESPDTGMWIIGSSDDDIAYVKVDGSGGIDVYGVSPGTCTITATLATNPKLIVTHEMTVESIDLTASGTTITWPNMNSYTYTGSAIKPVPKKVTFRFSDGNTVELGDSVYQLTYASNVNAGTASITMTGCGPCTGTVKKTFSIGKANIANASIAAIPDQTYTGSAIKPAPTIKLGSKTLVNGTDYTLSYKNNTAAGTATVVIAGKGSNVGGSTTRTFKIARASVASASVSGVSASYTYTRAAIAPNPTVKVGSRTLAKGTDYTVSYKNNVNTGTASVVITGKGNYTGSKTVSFKIVKTPAKWTRLWGQNRYATMQAIVKRGWSTTGGTVVVASGEGFKDALSASGIAGLERAPILLVGKQAVPSQTASELARLKPKKVLVIGGPAAVSNSVASRIKAITGVTPQRIYGATAPATASALNKAFKGRWAGSTAFLVTSQGFGDALSVSSVAYAKHYPVFLADNRNTVSSVTIAGMKACGVRQVIVIGGTNAISDKVVATLRSNGISLKARIGGSDRYATSRLVANWAFSNGATPERIGIATGRDYHDALSGAALCGRNNTVIVLADNSNRSNVSIVKAHKNEIDNAYVFGGTAAVGSATWAAMVAATS